MEVRLRPTPQSLSRAPRPKPHREAARAITPGRTSDCHRTGGAIRSGWRHRNTEKPRDRRASAASGVGPAAVSSGLKRPRIRRNVNGVFLESLERDDLESSLMRRCKNDICCRAVHVRPKPVGRGHTPPISGHKPWELILRHRRDQVITDPLLVFEKLSGDHSTDRVAPQVLGTGAAAPITKKAGDRIGTARGERSAQHIEVGHVPIIAREGRHVLAVAPLAIPIGMPVRSRSRRRNERHRPCPSPRQGRASASTSHNPARPFRIGDPAGSR